MSLEAEILADRARLKRKLRLWRFAGIGLLAFVIISSMVSASGYGDKLLRKDHIARVYISGIITDDQKKQKLFKKLAESKRVKAVILRINSPGGTTTGGEAFYESLNELSKKKPVVAVFGTVAASAAYMLAMATDHIVARSNTITGSVGVIFQWADVSELLKNVGVKMEEIKSGPLKATPSPFRTADAGGLRVAREMVDDSFDWFLTLVEKRRGLKAADVPGLKDGRIFSGRQAVKLNLVDEIGGEDEAIAWLESQKKITAKLPVHNWKVKKSSNFSLLTGMVRGVGYATGLSSAGLAAALSMDEVQGRLALSGLVSMWHPPLAGK